ncbi:MAG: hypothetical protein IJN29_15375 [Akkermansia sp.]|nr:hypothetical protein [Akkermansia sp.]
MTTNSIFFRTLSFCWLKLGLGMLNILIDGILLAVLLGIGLLFNSEGVFGIMLLVWLGCIGFVNFVLNHYLGYMAKAGHVAVIAESFRTGEIPASPIAVGKGLVMERFGTANVYFGVDKLVTRAVKQIQRMLGSLTGGVLSMLPGGENIQKLINYFLELALGYIDECCLCYTFYKKENNAYRSAADGVVLYAQNWKELLKNAAWIMLMVFASVIIITLILFVVFGLTFRALEWNGFIAFILSLMVAWAIKYAFVDSWIMVKMVHRYMTEAQTTPPAFDLYGKLSGWSASFRELFDKGRSDSSDAPTPANTEQPALPGLDNEETIPLSTSPEPVVAPTSESIAEEPPTRYCQACGAPLQPSKPFCAECGARVITGI